MNVAAPGADGRRRVTYLGTSGRPETATPDIVVCALPATRVASIIDELPATAMAVYKDADFAKFSKISYVLSADAAPGRADGAFFIPRHPDPQKRRVQMWSISPAAGQRPPVAVVALAHDEIAGWQASGQSLPEYAFPLLNALYPELDWSNVVDVVVNAGDYVPAMRVGFSARARALMESQTRHPSRLGWTCAARGRN